jgi:hypothetical protein
MSPIKSFIGRLLFPRQAKFVEDLSNALLRAVQETEKFDTSVKSLCLNWLAVCPHTYFGELFLKSVGWNETFVAAFDNSDMTNAQGCFNLTQAYYLRHLEQLIKQDPNYKKFSLDLLYGNIQAHMAFGNEISRAAEEFELSINSMSRPENFSMCYVEKLLSIQYSDEIKKINCLSALWIDSKSLLGLAIFTTESIKKAKYIDSQFGVT